MGVWSEVPAFLLGLVTLVVTTNAFGPQSTRRLRQLRTRAELLELLPEGPGASALARHLDDAVLDLVEGLDRPRRRWGPPEQLLVALAVLAAAVWIGGVSTAVVWDERPDWVQSLSLAGLVVTALCTATMALLNHRAAEEARTRRQPTDPGGPSRRPPA
jgi:peptidoglycan/LPS O-acetylase OafA/YrhL